MPATPRASGNASNTARQPKCRQHHRDFGASRSADNTAAISAPAEVQTTPPRQPKCQQPTAISARAEMQINLGDFRVSGNANNKAHYGTRTRDLFLTKEVLYQLS
jgi:hypothetical protein